MRGPLLALPIAADCHHHHIGLVSTSNYEITTRLKRNFNQFGQQTTLMFGKDSALGRLTKMQLASVNIIT